MTDRQKEFMFRAHDQHRNFKDRVNEATVKSAEAALKASLLINGGAVVSLLAFISGIIDGDRIKLVHVLPLSKTVVIFAGGILSAAISLALTYVVNYLTLMHASSFKEGFEYPYLVETEKSALLRNTKIVFHIGAVLLGFASLSFFLYGIFAFRNALEKLVSAA